MKVTGGRAEATWPGAEVETKASLRSCEAPSAG